SSYTVEYDSQISDVGAVSQISATAELTLVSWNSTTNQLELGVALTNNTSVAPYSARIGIFGFDTDPNRTGASVSGFFNKIGDGSISGGQFVETCGKNTPGNGAGCAGDGGTGVANGATENFTFLLTFADLTDTSVVSFSNFIVRY